MKFWLNHVHVTFNMCQSIWNLKYTQGVSMIETMEEDALTVPIEKRLGIESLM